MEQYSIEIETTGDYKTKKEFKKMADLNERQFLALTNTILDFLDNIGTEPIK